MDNIATVSIKLPTVSFSNVSYGRETHKKCVVSSLSITYSQPNQTNISCLWPRNGEDNYIKQSGFQSKA